MRDGLERCTGSARRVEAKEAKEECKKSGEIHGRDRSGEGNKEAREKRGSKPLLTTEISVMRERRRRNRERGRE